MNVVGGGCKRLNPPDRMARVGTLRTGTNATGRRPGGHGPKVPRRVCPVLHSRPHGEDREE